MKWISFYSISVALVLLLCTLHFRKAASFAKENEIHATNHLYYSADPVEDVELPATEAVPSFRVGLNLTEKEAVVGSGTKEMTIISETKNRTKTTIQVKRKGKKKKERVRSLQPLVFTKDGVDRHFVKLFASYPLVMCRARDFIYMDSIEWRSRVGLFNMMQFRSCVFSQTIYYSYVPYNRTFLIVLTEDGTRISAKFNNTIQLLALYKRSKGIDSVIFTDSPQIAAFVNEMGLLSMPISHKNEFGLPVLKHLLLDAKRAYDAEYYIYINSDILINPYIFHFTEFAKHRTRTKAVAVAESLNCSTCWRRMCTT